MATADVSLHYSFQCRNCRYSRHYGCAKLTALTKATSHALRLDHIVDVWEMNLTTLTTELIESIHQPTDPLPEEAPF